MIKIRVIGDSSSSGIGVYEYCYPYILSKELEEFADSEVVNYSVPALTSSDACRLYHSQIKTTKTDFLILYLGHNEGGFLPYKGPYTKIARFLKLFPPYDKRRSRLTKFKIRNKYEFSKTLPPVSIANSPSDFQYNMLSILKTTKRKGTRTILINPIGNDRYLSGVGSSNICYIKYVNHFDRVWDKLISADDETALLIQAIRDQENGDIQKAITIYEQLGHSKNEVVGFVSKNNMAVCYSSIDYLKSEEIFLKLVGQPEYYNSVIYANLSYLYNKINDKEKSKKYQKMSYENDFSLYRIRPEYRKVISELSKEFDVIYIDLNDLLNADDFIDYCHPTYEGYIKIAKKIANFIKDELNSNRTKYKSKYKNEFINPNYYFNQKESLIDYFVMDFDIPNEIITGELAKILDSNKDKCSQSDQQGVKKTSVLEDYLVNFLEINKTHPTFTDELDLLGVHAPQSQEILNFPEFYIYRLLMNYYAVFENKVIAKKCDVPSNLTEYALSSEKYRNFILKNNSYPLNFNLNYEVNYLKSIDRKILDVLKQNSIYENTLPLRQKTIMYWYMREAFRYGSHSRFSVFYRRWDIDKIIEAIIVCLVIAFENKLENKYGKYKNVLDKMKILIDTHERNVKNILMNYDERCMDQYASELTCIKSIILNDLENGSII